MGFITVIGALLGEWGLKKAFWGFSKAAAMALVVYFLSKLTIGVALTGFTLPAVPAAIACCLVELDFSTCASALVAAAVFKWQWTAIKLALSAS